MSARVAKSASWPAPVGLARPLVALGIVLVGAGGCSVPPGSVPSADLRQPAEPIDPLLDALRSPDAAERDRAKTEIGGLSAERRIPLLLAGIRLQHRGAATWCASRLEWQHVDPAEARRLVRLLEPELFKERSKAVVDFDEFRWNLGSSELGPILRKLQTAEVTVGEPSNMFGQLHRQLRPEHYPILCDVYVTADPEVACEVMSNLSTAIMRTLQHKEAIGRALLRRPFGAVPRTKTNRFGVGPAGPVRVFPVEPGYTGVLRALLSHFFLGKKLADRDRFETWLYRWSLTETPAPGDLAQLCDLLRSTSLWAQLIALHGLRRLGGEATRPALAAWHARAAEKGDVDASLRALCLVALERSGAKSGREALNRLARAHPGALGVLITHDPVAGRRVLLEQLATEPESFAGTLRSLVELDTEGYGYFGSPLPEGFYAGLEVPVLAARLPGARLARICDAWPGPSRTLVFEAARRLALAKSDREFDSDDARTMRGSELRRFLFLLEVLSVDRLRATLRAQVARGNHSACDLLLPFAQDRDTVALRKWVEATESGPEWADWAKLGFSSDRHVLAKVRAGCEKLDRDCMVAIGKALGLPRQFESIVIHSSESTRKRIATALLAGKPMRAVAVAIDAGMSEQRCVVRSLGFLEGERIRRHLLEAREQRHDGSCWLAIQELARQGHAASRREVEEIVRTGRYQWVDELAASVAIPTSDLATIRFWASELETNCCRGSTAWNILDARLMGVGNHHGNQVRNHAEIFELYLRRCRGRLAWSRLAQAFVPVPR